MPSPRLSLSYPQCEKDIVKYYSNKMVISPAAAERLTWEGTCDPDFPVYVTFLSIMSYFWLSYWEGHLC